MMDRRALTTLLHLLRKEAREQLFAHGPGINKPGGLFLTPAEMEDWADLIELKGELTPPADSGSLNAGPSNNEDLL